MKQIRDSVKDVDVSISWSIKLFQNWIKFRLSSCANQSGGVLSRPAAFLLDCFHSPRDTKGASAEVATFFLGINYRLGKCARDNLLPCHAADRIVFDKRSVVGDAFGSTVGCALTPASPIGSERRKRASFLIMSQRPLHLQAVSQRQQGHRAQPFLLLPFARLR